jgi:hypothetical protein
LTFDEKERGKVLRQNIAALKKLQRTIYKEFEKKFTSPIRDIRPKFDEIFDYTEYESKMLGFPPKLFSRSEREIFDALTEQMLDELEKLGEEAKNFLIKDLYDSVLSGAEFSDLSHRVRQTLTGAEKAYTKLSNSSQTFIQDEVMGFYSAIQKAKSDKLGLEKFLYYGDIMSRTRAFCIARAGLVFTKAQINSWQDMRPKWDGYKRGNIWIVRGGWY